MEITAVSVHSNQSWNHNSVLPCTKLIEINEKLLP